MRYYADPGGVFATDVHRRVCGHLHDEAQEIGALAERVDPDDHTPLGSGDESDLLEVLGDLEDEGYASRSKDGYKLTKKGLDALQAPVPGSED